MGSCTLPSEGILPHLASQNTRGESESRAEAWVSLTCRWAFPLGLPATIRGPRDTLAYYGACFFLEGGGGAHGFEGLMLLDWFLHGLIWNPKITVCFTGILLRAKFLFGKGASWFHVHLQGGNLNSFQANTRKHKHTYTRKQTNKQTNKQANKTNQSKAKQTKPNQTKQKPTNQPTIQPTKQASKQASKQTHKHTMQVPRKKKKKKKKKKRNSTQPRLIWHK